MVRTNREEMGEEMAVPIQAGTYGVVYLTHSVPAFLGPSASCRAWVQVRNDGTLTWRRESRESQPVNLVVWAGQSPPKSFDLPVDGLLSGQTATIPVEFETPSSPGVCRIKFDLVHQNVTFFEDQGCDTLMVEATVTPGENDPEARRHPPKTARVVPTHAACFLEHSSPKVVQPGARFGIWLHIQNRGTLTWQTDNAQGRHVRVSLRIDGKLEAGSDLSVPVLPFEDAHVHMTVPAPLQSGHHRLKFDLVHEGVSFFESRGSETLNLELEVGSGSQPVGSRLYETALRRDSWFYQPSAGVAFARDGSSYPIFVTAAKGCHVWDTEGRRHIDYTIGWGSALLGHAYPPVQEAVSRSLGCGAMLPLPHPIEIEVSEMLCDDIPCAEMVAFGKNGSDACTLAARLARLATGRRVILTCGYHGWQDWFAEALGFEGTGVPPRQQPLSCRFEFNNLSDFRAKLAAHRGDLAGVMLEPAGASQDGQAPAEDVDPSFLRALAADTREAGGLLIFDEIITGFRYPGGGIQKAHGVVPDLACFGKALGAGMPLSALVGKAEILGAHMPKTFYGPTYKGEIYSLAAARVALETYRREPVAEYVWNFGQKIKDEINLLCRTSGFAAAMMGPPFRFGLVIHEPDPDKLRLLRTLYLQELLRRGVITYSGVMLPSYAHDDQALDHTLAAISSAIGVVQRSESRGNLHRDLEMPLYRM